MASPDRFDAPRQLRPYHQPLNTPSSLRFHFHLWNRPDATCSIISTSEGIIFFTVSHCHRLQSNTVAEPDNRHPINDDSGYHPKLNISPALDIAAWFSF
jgi:hypothetical protein